MKLYHKNTDQLVKVGDIFHLTGSDFWVNKWYSTFCVVTNRFSYLHLSINYLNMEWR